MTTAYTFIPSPGHVYPDHPERPGRLDLLQPRLKNYNAQILDSKPASRDEISLVHDPRLVSALEKICREQAPGIIDYAPTYVTRTSFDDALLAAGGVTPCTRAILRSEAENAFAIVRPPGHHAEPDRAMGFCLFNNIAIGARVALGEGLERVMVIDYDAHHGNGTQAAFLHEGRVAFLSAHQWGIYPGSGWLEDAPHAKKRIVNVPPTKEAVEQWTGTPEVAVPGFLARYGVTAVEPALRNEGPDGMTPLERHFGFDRLFKLRVPEGTDIVALAARLAGDPQIEVAHPNYLGHGGQARPDDTHFTPQQWDKDNTGQTGGTADADIDAPESWVLATGRPETRVAVLDSGIDGDHIEFLGRLARGGYDFDIFEGGPTRFSSNRLVANPERGIADFGPLDEFKMRPVIRVGAIGTPESIDRLSTYLHGIAGRVSAGTNARDKAFDPIVHPDFPGTNPDLAFALR